MRITSVLLAGGQNKRMNHYPKWDLLMGQETALERSIRKLADFSEEILIVTGGNHQISFQQKTDNPIKVIYDETPYLGPLNAIGTALKHSHTVYHFVIAADMPFFSIKLAALMLNYALKTNTDMVIPKWKDKIQPLHGIYSSHVYESIDGEIKQGKNSLIKWILDYQNVKIFEEKEVQPFNTNGNLFFNMNHPEDYQQALKWMAEEE